MDGVKCKLDYIKCECEFCSSLRKNTALMVKAYNEKKATLTEIGKRIGCSRVIIRNRFLLCGYVKNEKGKYVLK